MATSSTVYIYIPKVKKINLKSVPPDSVPEVLKMRFQKTASGIYIPEE